MIIANDTIRRVPRPKEPVFTSPYRYSVAGTAFRVPTIGASSATNRFMLVEFWFGTPDYTIYDPRFFMPSFWSPTSPGEVTIAAGESIVIQGASIEATSGVWTQCDGAAEAGVATITDAGPGAWLPRVAVTLNANTMYRARVAFVVSNLNVLIPRDGFSASTVATGGQNRQEGSTTTRFARLATTGANVSNSGGINYNPMMMIAKGGDGRPAVVVFGDSIGYGGEDPHSVRTSRNVSGYVERGLDSNIGAKRLAYAILACPGQRPVGTNGWDVEANWSRKIAALKAVETEYGVLPFDLVLSQHITNGVAYTGDGNDLKIGMGRYFDLIATKFGKPITQIEGIPHTTSTDAWQTVANQTEANGKSAASTNLGHMWTFNADVGGVGGLGSPAAHYRAARKITDSIAPWRLMSADLTTNRGKLAVRPFGTTLAAAYVSGSVITTIAAPAPGSFVSMMQDSGTSGTARAVITVTGTGPYTVTVNGSLGTAASVGNVVKEVGGDGLHPSTPVYIELSQAIIDWKRKRGF